MLHKPKSDDRQDVGPAGFVFNERENRFLIFAIEGLAGRRSGTHSRRRGAKKPIAAHFKSKKRKTQMNRLLKFFVVAVLAFVGTGLLLAQSDPFVGTWKLNAVKSKFGTVPLPKSSTRTVVAQGAGLKISYEGVAADGSRVAYEYTINFDGKDSVISGTGQSNGADTIVTKRIDTHTISSTLKKAGKVVATTKGIVSQDGKTYTIDSQGSDANGKPRNVVSIYEKQ
jgi:hypothetical protein